MQKAYLHLIKYALDRDLVLETWCEGEIDCQPTTSYNEVKRYIEDVDFPTLVLKDKEGNSVGAAAIMWGWDAAPDETVADYSANDFMNTWWDEYQSTIEEN